MADGPFAWTALLSVLLLAYESRLHSTTTKSAVLRGILWGLISTLGTMTKLSFLYFVATVVPPLFYTMVQRSGPRAAIAALSACVCISSPCALYLALWGSYSWSLARTSSFGGVASFYYAPMFKFFFDVVRESPGIGVLVLMVLLAAGYLLAKRSSSWADVLPVLIVLGYGIIVIASPNREFRFLFPVVVAVPFQLAILLSGDSTPVPKRWAMAAGSLGLLILIGGALPTRNRPQWRSFARCNAVLVAADRWKAGRIVLATDSPTLNGQLMMVAGLYSSRPTNIYSLAYTAMGKTPLEEDFRILRSADLIVFQNRAALSPPFTNQRVSEYEQYVKQVGIGPIEIADDISVYLVSRNGQANIPTR